MIFGKDMMMAWVGVEALDKKAINISYNLEVELNRLADG